MNREQQPRPTRKPDWLSTFKDRAMNLVAAFRRERRGPTAFVGNPIDRIHVAEPGRFDVGQRAAEFNLIGHSGMIERPRLDCELPNQESALTLLAGTSIHQVVISECFQAE